MGPFVPERQVEYWTNRSIENAMLQANVDVRAYPITQRLEKTLGVDAIFAGSPDLVKVFGLQHKALYKGTSPFWPLQRDQHDVLLNSDWAYYCLSDMRTMREAASALHLARFYKPSDVSDSPAPSRFRPSGERYRRWAGFLAGLRTCSMGVRVDSAQELQALLSDDPEAREIVDSVFVVAFESDDDDARTMTKAVIQSGDVGERDPDQVQ
jgi:hypothetical protein